MTNAGGKAYNNENIVAEIVSEWGKANYCTTADECIFSRTGVPGINASSRLCCGCSTTSNDKCGMQIL